jgi:putative flippase GtrA
VKFGIVGTTSATLEMAVLHATVLAFGRGDVIVWLGAILGTCCAIVNGFYWNRRWTFRAEGFGDAAPQFARYVVVAAVGIGLNLALFGLFYFRLRLFHPWEYSHVASKALASLCVAAWSFLANGNWTFRRRH